MASPARTAVGASRHCPPLKGAPLSPRVDSFRDLVVYRTMFELQQDIFRLSKGFPSEERYSLTDQMRRSSRSVGANIAEARAKRRY